MPDLPYNVAHIWEEYVVILNGCEDVDYVTLDAYQRVTGNNLSAWECSVMFKLDTVRKKHDA